MAEPLPVAILIEDERQIRRFVRTALETEGWNVHETETLKQSVETLRKYNQNIKKDPDAQQLEIRKNLEMMRPGEMEFRYPKEQVKPGTN